MPPHAPSPSAPAPPRHPPDHTVSGLAQWAAHTLGRIVPDGYSWMQAVHWAHDHGHHTHHRSHGPQRLNRTTLRLAAVLACLKECRPGVDNLAAWLKLSERTVQYHLRLLRETGLLAYLAKGTRVSGVGGRASEFARTAPPAFDESLGLRTGPSERYIRTVSGITPASRTLMARLGKMARRSIIAARKRLKSVTRTASPTPAAPGRCTPMRLRSCSSPTTGTTPSPSENAPTDERRPSRPQTPSGHSRRLNTVGRRYQLAYQLIERVPWLHRAAVPRIAWAVRHLADAGWTVTEVLALLSQQAPAERVYRPSGFLARRLHGAHQLYDTPARRETLVTSWLDSPRTQAERHEEWEGAWQRPRSRSVVRLVDQAVAAVRLGTARPLPEQDDGGLTDDQLHVHRHTAYQAFLAGDTALVTSAVAFLGRCAAERLYGRSLVDRALRLHDTSPCITMGTHQ
ncbi:transcriptional regulator [Streptomyces sp. NPDC057654]|uniref:transcriptional regulator n=1 Tax=Streptomyces sp. NPDC057654 TaxID=3346196 RepID=UPI0036839AAB